MVAKKATNLILRLRAASVVRKHANQIFKGIKDAAKIRAGERQAISFDDFLKRF